MRWYAVQAIGIVVALVLIFMAWNALGYVDVVILGAIGAVVAWEAGRLALVGYHGTGREIVCPRCGSRVAPTDRCPTCGHWFHPPAAELLRRARHRRKSV